MLLLKSNIRYGREFYSYGRASILVFYYTVCYNLSSWANYEYFTSDYFHQSATCLLAFHLPFILLKFGQQAILSLFIFWLGTVSCVSIVSISIDRFLMVTYPIKHRIWMKGRFMSLWVRAIWIVSCMPSVVSLWVIIRRVAWMEFSFWVSSLL